jgi:5-deoxy-glucuronate isomerase
MHLSHKAPFAWGYEALVSREGPNADILMDFGSLSLGDDETWASGHPDEKAFLLASGEVEFAWPGGKEGAARGSLFDEAPGVLLLPDGVEVKIRAGRGGARLYVIRTANPTSFPARFYPPSSCRSERRGAGTMRETSTRIVRTVFDDTDQPLSNLVLGEVVGVPGKWSSYPPHFHPQPEIYHYRFLPDTGFGLTAIGEEAYLLRDRSTILIRDGKVHPQVTAPGYAMWYLWVIRHLDGNRYRSPWPVFVDEHAWVMSKDAKIWEPLPERGKH